MKILLTTHQFFPEYMAGTEVLTLSVAKDLLRRGHEIRIFTGFPSEKHLTDSQRFDEYEFEGIHVYRFHHAYAPMAGQTSMIEVGYDSHLAAFHFEEILKDFKPDVLHFFHLNRLGTRLIEKADQAVIPAYMTLTDFWSICPTGQLLLPDGKFCNGPDHNAGNCVKHFAQNTQKGLAGAVAKWIPTVFVNVLTKISASNILPTHPVLTEVNAISVRLRVNISRLNRLKKIIAPNKMMRDILIANGIDSSRVVQFSFGIDVLGNNSKSMVRGLRRPLRIGYIGTLAMHKGCHILIKAFKSLPTDRATLNIYGSPVDFPEYSNELKLLATGRDDIRFCGTFPNSIISQVLADLDVLVVPSIWHENSPLVIYSSQATGCPVVSSDLRGISEVIWDEVNGLLFEPGNSAALEKQLLRLIEDSGLLSKLSSNAKQPKSTSTYVDELLSIWEADLIN
ncbi:MAG: glycosyltransferase [Rhodoferax sp.]|uniref:glycosyltransferase n=1 Tax=Rhodoferax sp. TaxID=50421 RepID=UPI003266ACED